MRWLHDGCSRVADGGGRQNGLTDFGLTGIEDVNALIDTLAASITVSGQEVTVRPCVSVLALCS
jgi:hypothetical protein